MIDILEIILNFWIPLSETKVIVKNVSKNACPVFSCLLIDWPLLHVFWVETKIGYDLSFFIWILIKSDWGSVSQWLHWKNQIWLFLVFTWWGESVTSLMVAGKSTFKAQHTFKKYAYQIDPIIYCFWYNEVQNDPWMHSEANLYSLIKFQNIVQYWVQMSYCKFFCLVCQKLILCPHLPHMNRVQLAVVESCYAQESFLFQHLFFLNYLRYFNKGKWNMMMNSLTKA